jgi:hypothetical protein
VSTRASEPLEPGKVYRTSRILFAPTVEQSYLDVGLIRLTVESMLADLLGPYHERIRIPIGAGGIKITLTAQVDAVLREEK